MTTETITNQYGRQEAYKVLRAEGKAGLAKDKDGRFQALKRTTNALTGQEEWTCVKFPNHDKELVWSWAQAA